MEPPTQRIPGLTLLHSNPSYPKTTKYTMLNAQASVANPLWEEAAVPLWEGAAVPQESGLINLQDWLDSNPEPSVEPYRPQQNKAKKESALPSIVPTLWDPNDKTNWVGTLHEYWSSLPNVPEPGTMKEEQLDLPPPYLFTCTITTSVSPKPFGGADFAFVKKKDAKQHAAKQAVEYLIQNGHITSQLKSKLPEPRKSGTPTKSNTPTKPIEEQSIPAQVNHLSHKLGFKSPTYIINLVPETVAMFSGYAKFEDEPLIVGKVGEFFNVWAKKSAKEQCATEVLKFLQAIEKHREETGYYGDGSSCAKRKMYAGEIEDEEMSEYETPKEF